MLVTKEPWTLHLYWDGRQGLGSLPKRDLELRHLSKAGPISSAKEQTGREKKKSFCKKKLSREVGSFLALLEKWKGSLS